MIDGIEHHGGVNLGRYLPPLAPGNFPAPRFGLALAFSFLYVKQPGPVASARTPSIQMPRASDAGTDFI